MMKGKTMIFFMTDFTLFRFSMASLCFRGDVSEYFGDIGLYGLRVQDFLCVVEEQDVYSSVCGKHVLLCSITLTQTSFQQISLDCPLEVPLRHGYHDAMTVAFGPEEVTELDIAASPPTSLVHKDANIGLARDYLILGQCIIHCCS